MAASAAGTAPAAVPRQPAWTAASTRAAGSTRASGDAVGDEDDQSDVGRRRHAGYRRRARRRPRRRCRGPQSSAADEHGPGAVDLPGEDHGVEADAERRRRPRPVGRHVAGPVAHVQSEVQRLVGRPRHAAVPGGDGNRRAELGRLDPRDQGNGRQARARHATLPSTPRRALRESPVSRAQEASLSSHTVVGTTESSGRRRRRAAEGCSSAKPYSSAVSVPGSLTGSDDPLAAAGGRAARAPQRGTGPHPARRRGPGAIRGRSPRPGAGGRPRAGSGAGRRRGRSVPAARGGAAGRASAATVCAGWWSRPRRPARRWSSPSVLPCPLVPCPLDKYDRYSCNIKHRHTGPGERCERWD